MTTELPTTTGYYWYRRTPSHKWQVIEIRENGPGYLEASDLSTRSFLGLQLRNWKDRGNPVGEWSKCEMPA